MESCQRSCSSSSTSGSHHARTTAPMAGMASVLTRLLSAETDHKQVILSAQPRVKRKRTAGNRVHSKRRENAVEVDKEEEAEIKEEDDIEVKKKVKGSEKFDAVQLCHTTPDHTHWSYEKSMQRIATRGVVQVFNAVYKHQQELENKLKEAGSSDSKRSKVIQTVDKGSFLDMLRGGGTPGTSKKTSNKRSPQAVEVDQPAWSILRDDYSLKSSMKEWEEDKPETDSDDNEDTE